ncbi:polyadenylate-binding protein 1-B-binding protein [Thalictrum thalictroides]|uniref:Polyadenylate-binding protein 1-B-binding protein n=1 Tax=Thalictrum thalictroides TaxID=46969 RepID=A0A7J6VDA4_THATH|nr:polyadenylate-binding protein 1-B-binding protein [Thalictrum thalictroides]
MYGRAAMTKSMELLKGKTGMAMLFVLLHLSLCCIIEGLFGLSMLKSWKIKASLGALLIVCMVILNLVGLLVQSIFYYVCKIYHNEKVDKNELQQHLGGYVGELVPLNSTIELQNQSMEAGDM